MFLQYDFCSLLTPRPEGRGQARAASAGEGRQQPCALPREASIPMKFTTDPVARLIPGGVAIEELLAYLIP
jgi:hypothetical protein